MGIVNSMKGLEKARIVKTCYAIEYDYFDPRDSFKPTLETKTIKGLFFAGQQMEQQVMKRLLLKDY